MELCNLCHAWKTKVQPIPSCHNPESWGPSEEELKNAAVWKVTGSWNETVEEVLHEHNGDSDSDEADWIDVIGDDGDDELLESVEAVAFSDEYRGGGTDHLGYEHADHPTLLDSHGRGNQSPNKRVREI